MSEEILRVIRLMGPEELAMFLAMGGVVPPRTRALFQAEALRRDVGKEWWGKRPIEPKAPARRVVA